MVIIFIIIINIIMIIIIDTATIRIWISIYKTIKFKHWLCTCMDSHKLPL